VGQRTSASNSTIINDTTPSRIVPSINKFQKTYRPVRRFLMGRKKILPIEFTKLKKEEGRKRNFCARRGNSRYSSSTFASGIKILRKRLRQCRPRLRPTQSSLMETWQREKKWQTWRVTNWNDLLGKIIRNSPFFSTQNTPYPLIAA